MTTPIAPLFQQWTISRSEEMPAELDLAGCVAITRDTNHYGWLGKMIFTVQTIHNAAMRLLFGWEPTDVNLRHGSIILGRDPNPNKPDNLIIAHSVFTGIKLNSWNPKTDATITQTLIWQPKEIGLRSALLKYARQTAYNSRSHEPDYHVQPADFSIRDMWMALFYNHNTVPTDSAMTRTARAATQLLIGEQLLNADTSSPNSYFCSPYVITLLQATLMIEVLTPEEKLRITEGHTSTPERINELATFLFNGLKTKAHTVEGTLSGMARVSERFWSNPICQLDGQYVYSCYAAEALNKVSEPA